MVFGIFAINNFFDNIFRPSSPQTHLTIDSPNSKGESSTGQENNLGLQSYLDEACAGTATPGTITPGTPATPTSTTFEGNEDITDKLVLPNNMSGGSRKGLGHCRSASEPPFINDGKQSEVAKSGQLSEGYGSMTTQSTSSCSDAGRRYWNMRNLAPLFFFYLQLVKLCFFLIYLHLVKLCHISYSIYNNSDVKKFDFQMAMYIHMFQIQKNSNSE